MNISGLLTHSCRTRISFGCLFALCMAAASSAGADTPNLPEAPAPTATPIVCPEVEKPDCGDGELKEELYDYMGLQCPKYSCVPRARDCVWVAAWADCSGWFGIYDVCGSYHSKVIKDFTISNRKALPGCFLDRWKGKCLSEGATGNPGTAQTSTVKFWGGCHGTGPSGWATGGELANFLGVPDDMRGNIPKSYNIAGGNPASWWYMDENCKYTAAPAGTEICGYAGISWSPISLIWERGASLNDGVTVVPFALDPSGARGFSLWKASAQAPLLVYDPERSGRVSSAKQLFGSYAFGGRTGTPASIADDELREPWDNGYQALGLLDADDDGEISGEELAPLSLWFDGNRNGAADAGEVRPVRDEGVTALYYRGAQGQTGSKDVGLETGWERVVEGQTLRGPSVDWFAETFAARQEAEAALRVLFTHQQARTGAAAQLDSWLHDAMKFAPRPIGKHERDVSGYWLWSTDEPNGIAHPGIFAFQQLERDKVIGFSIVESVLEENDKNLRSAVMALPASGSLAFNNAGKGRLTFDIEDQASGSSSQSSAALSEDGTTLFGETSQTFSAAPAVGGGSATVRYKWVARKFVD